MRKYVGVCFVYLYPLSGFPLKPHVSLRAFFIVSLYGTQAVLCSLAVSIFLLSAGCHGDSPAFVDFDDYDDDEDDHSFGMVVSFSLMTHDRMR